MTEDHPGESGTSIFTSYYGMDIGMPWSQQPECRGRTRGLTIPVMASTIRVFVPIPDQQGNAIKTLTPATTDDGVGFLPSVSIFC